MAFLGNKNMVAWLLMLRAGSWTDSATVSNIHNNML